MSIYNLFVGMEGLKSHFFFKTIIKYKYLLHNIK